MLRGGKRVCIRPGSQNDMHVLLPLIGFQSGQISKGGVRVASGQPGEEQMLERGKIHIPGQFARRTQQVSNFLVAEAGDVGLQLGIHSIGSIPA